jgi:hypothetical protein
MERLKANGRILPLGICGTKSAESRRRGSGKEINSKQNRCITITILDVIHRLVFYLKLTEHTLRLRYESNMLMLSIGVNITVTILDIIHRPVFYLKLN